MHKRALFLISFFIAFYTQVCPVAAQLNPLSSQYFINEYLINPAFAGKEDGTTLQATYRKQWSGMPGSPVTQNITADFGLNRVGLGLNVNNERAGLLRQTRMLGTYAYHLPLDSGKHQLHFGLSLGMLTQRVEYADMNGDPSDVVVGDYNNQKNYIDGDFGIAYTSGGLNLQLAIPNMKNFFKRDMRNVSDIVTFYSAVSYLLDLNEQIAMEPKIAFMGVRNFKNRVDLGMQFEFGGRRFNAAGIYHGNQSATFGAGFNFSNKLMLTGLYTTGTSILNNYMNGSFEMNLKFHIND